MWLQVRYIFEGQDTASHAGSKRQQKAKDAAAATDATANESLHAIKRVLRNVMVHEKSIITSWCSRNATQMRNSLESVVTMQEQADVMGSELLASHQNLRVCCF